MKKLIFFILLLASPAWATTYFYIDPDPNEAGVTWSRVNGERYTSTDEDFPGEGVGYDTIKNAFAAATDTDGGNHFYLRDGTYQEGQIVFPQTIKHAVGPWTDISKFNSIQSYPGEWAILDGQGTNTPYGIVLGDWGYGDAASIQVNYWLFERLEITGGGGTTAISNAGIWASVGPNKFRYLYIHDNLSPDYGLLPGGIKSVQPKSTTIEFCSFYNNGDSRAGASSNSSHLMLIADYSPESNKQTIAANGYTDGSGMEKNIIRYNYFEKGATAIHIKGTQLLAKRGTVADPGLWDDTYIEYGDDIHHNIMVDFYEYVVMACQDFVKVHHNIFDTPLVQALSFAYNLAGVETIYKGSSWNNTFISPAQNAIVRLGSPHYPTAETATEEIKMYGADYNNLMTDGTGVYANLGSYINYNRWQTTQNPNYYDLTGIKSSNNCFYNPGDTDVYSFHRYDPGYEANLMTSAEYEAQTTYTDQTNKVSYTKTGDSPFVGGGGANDYITIGSTVIESGTPDKTIANGGIGGSHPYLSGVTLPSYIGATDPDDNSWVAGVLSLATYTNLRDADPGSDPSWIEGSESEATPNITGLKSMTGGTLQ